MIYGLFGSPGAGKSYILVTEAIKAMKKGKTVFSNFPIRTLKYGNSFKLSKEMLKKGEFPPNSVLIIDEAGAVFNSRDWKNFDISLFMMFTQHRHQGVDIYYGTPGAGRVDVVIRELTNVFYWVTNYKIPWIDFEFGYKTIKPIFNINLNIPYIKKIKLVPKILFFKIVGVTDMNYLGRKNLPKDLRDMYVYNKRFYLFRSSNANCYDTLYYRKDLDFDKMVFDKW